jgi:threonine synthase
MSDDYTPSLHCVDCGAPPANPVDWKCAACGGLIEIDNPRPFMPDAINRDAWSLWRYAAMLPVQPVVTLGEGLTPLVETVIDDLPLYAKLEFTNPTGSYKDRGTVMVINHLLAHGVTDVVETSSGNAGSSVTSYASAAGMRARIFVPANAPEGKLRQMRMAGDVVLVEGAKADVSRACVDAVTGDVAFASHSHSPFFIYGQMTAAWELWEQTGGDLPEAIVIPVGMGCFLLGYYRGFKLLREAGLTDFIPRLYAVQTDACDPIVRGWEHGLDHPVDVTPGKTSADGIVIPSPLRGDEIMTALRDSGGAAIRVYEDDILPAREKLARRGLYVEPTSATTLAAVPQVLDHAGDRARIVLNLTGHGLKSG